MYTYSEIKVCIDKAWHSICNLAREMRMNSTEYCYFPLFILEPEKNNFKIGEFHTSGISQGISILASSPEFLDTNEERRIFQKAIKLLCKIQNESGGWPSITVLSEARKIEKMEGMINDTTFALKSLFDSGLPALNHEIVDLPIKKQLETIFDGLKWLLSNRTHQGWYFFEKDYIRKEDVGTLLPYVLPTSYVVHFFNIAENKLRKIINELKHSRNKDNYQHQVFRGNELLNELNYARINAINWLNTIQNFDGGFGYYSGCDSSYSNSILALRALLTDDSSKQNESMKKSANALNYILAINYKKIQNLPDKDIFESYNQIFICKEQKTTKIYKRLISHETYVKGQLLQVLIDVLKKKWIIDGKERNLIENLTIRKRLKYRKLIRDNVKALIDSQEKMGSYSGLFKGSRREPFHFPIYATENGIYGLIKFLNSYEEATKLPNFRKLSLYLLILSIPFLFFLFISYFFKLDLIEHLVLPLFADLILAIYLIFPKKITRLFKDK